MTRKTIMTDFSQLERCIAAQADAPRSDQGTGRQPSEPEVQRLPIDPVVKAAWQQIAAAMPRYGKKQGDR